MAHPLWTTVGVVRWVLDRTMSMKSVALGTTLMALKLTAGMVRVGRADGERKEAAPGSGGRKTAAGVGRALREVARAPA